MEQLITAAEARTNNIKQQSDIKQQMLSLLNKEIRLAIEQGKRCVSITKYTHGMLQKELFYAGYTLSQKYIADELNNGLIEVEW